MAKPRQAAKGFDVQIVGLVIPLRKKPKGPAKPFVKRQSRCTLSPTSFTLPFRHSPFPRPNHDLYSKLYNPLSTSYFLIRLHCNKRSAVQYRCPFYGATRSQIRLYKPQQTRRRHFHYTVTICSGQDNEPESSQNQKITGSIRWHSPYFSRSPERSNRQVPSTTNQSSYICPILPIKPNLHAKRSHQAN
jgi:hypothetical protein